MNGISVDLQDVAPAARVEFVSRRNCSIGPRAMLTVFASLVTLSFGFGVAFASQGPWLILPFAGLEMAAVGAAFVLCGRRVGAAERIRFDDDGLTIEQIEAGQRSVQRFNPPWARLVIVRGAHSIRVLLSQSGRELELGAHLGFERRAAFARSFETAFRAAARA